MTKRLAMAFGLGATLPLLAALYAGGENVAQAGLRLAAIEQGFALASRHWQFEATPAHEPAQVALYADSGPESCGSLTNPCRPSNWPAPAPAKPPKRTRR